MAPAETWCQSSQRALSVAGRSAQSVDSFSQHFVFYSFKCVPPFEETAIHL